MPLAALTWHHGFPSRDAGDTRFVPVLLCNMAFLCPFHSPKVVVIQPHTFFSLAQPTDPFLGEIIEVRACLGYPDIPAWGGLFPASLATGIHTYQSWKWVSWENRRQLCYLPPYAPLNWEKESPQSMPPISHSSVQ